MQNEKAGPSFLNPAFGPQYYINWAETEGLRVQYHPQPPSESETSLGYGTRKVRVRHRNLALNIPLREREREKKIGLKLGTRRLKQEDHVFKASL